MPKKLKRYYGQKHLHFITTSCYRRQPHLGSARARNRFVKVLHEVRQRYGFRLIGYVVMPEHVHLLISEPQRGTPSTVMQVLKQRVARAMRQRRKQPANQPALWSAPDAPPPFWQRRFYDFNVWSEKKKAEKLNYMHANPVTRGLVQKPSHPSAETAEGWGTRQHPCPTWLYVRKPLNRRVAGPFRWSLSWGMATPDERMIPSPDFTTG